MIETEITIKIENNKIIIWITLLEKILDKTNKIADKIKKTTENIIWQEKTESPQCIIGKSGSIVGL